MIPSQLARRDFLRAVAASGASCLAAGACAVEPQNGSNLREPVHRIAKAGNELPGPIERHPLDPALDIARAALVRMAEIPDYTCRMAKQERINGKLGELEQMDVKVRNRRVDATGKLIVPLSVYMKFISPKSIAGREVIWVEQQNNNKLRAHEGGFIGGRLPSVWLDPDGPVAMRNQLHPIYDIGIENLILKLIERGEKERQFGECEVNFIPGGKINGRPCTVLIVMHPVQRPHFEFHKAEIFIDDDWKVPIHYAAYHWPAKAGEKDLPVLERYTHYNVKLDVGLTDADFNSNNPNYNF